MNNELKFRNLFAEEIDVRIGQINKGGVMLLLYKDARADQTILDETVGPLNWQRKHSRDNANCIVSIYDASKNQWVEKEDTGVESFTEKEKGLASDSFKRACVNFGIGRELYTAPDIFIGKDKLDAYSAPTQNAKGTCYNKFRVKDIKYIGDEKKIASVTIEVLDSYGNTVQHTMTFSNNTSTPAPSPTQAKQTTSAPVTASSPNCLIPDDEIILIGNCKGKKYGDVKNTETFKSFLNWVSKTTTSYTDEKAANQFKRLKALTA